MYIYAMKDHNGEGSFPTFVKGEAVTNIYPCKQYEFWSGGIIDGYETYFPNTYLENGHLNRDYNPTELIVKAGDQLELIKVAFDWAYVKNKSGKQGWLPFQILYMK